jgi:hypothetical protein
MIYKQATDWEVLLGIMIGLARLNGGIDTRLAALGVIQRCLFTQGVFQDHMERIENVYKMVLVPYMESTKNKMTSVMTRAEREQEEELCCRAIRMSSNFYLNWSHRMGEYKEMMIRVWFLYLECVRDIGIKPERVGVVEAIREALKNMMMVFRSDRIFEEEDAFWGDSWNIIDKICPGLKEEVVVGHKEDGEASTS